MFYCKPLSRPTIFRWYTNPGGSASDAPSKSWQRRMRLEIVDVVVEILNQNPHCTTRDLARLLPYSKSTFLMWLTGLFYKNKWITTLPHNLPFSHECERQRIERLLFDCGRAVHPSMKLKLTMRSGLLGVVPWLRPTAEWASMA